MMPVPSHLVRCVIPKEATVDESPLDADVQCPCGERSFRVFFPGALHEWAGEMVPCTIKIGGKFFFLIEVQCTRCEVKQLLIDQDFHGWNGFVAHDDEQASLPRPPLVPWRCRKCDAIDHEVSVQIQTQGKEYFVTELDYDCEEELWPDAFDSFGITIRCTQCGETTVDWISLETA